MFFAVPVVGRALAGVAAAEASQNISAPQKIDQLKQQASSSGVDFAQTLSNLGQTAVSQAAQPAQSSLLSTALSIASKL